MDAKKRRFYLDDDNVIHSFEQDNCCESGGLGARYFRCMQLYKNNIAQIDTETGKIETYSSLFQKSVRTAIEMKNRGVMLGDLVSICSGNHLDVCLPFIAAMFLGAVTVNMDVNMSTEEMELFIGMFAPKIIFASEDVGHTLYEIIRRTKMETVLVVFGSKEFDGFLGSKEEEEGTFRPLPIRSTDDTAHIFLSSGTTGVPKGIKISHKAHLNQVEKLISDGRDGKYLDVILCFTSMYWISASWMITAAVTLGTTRLITKSFDPLKTWCYIDKYKVTYAYLVTRMLILMEKTTCPPGSNLESLRLLVTAGESLSSDVVLRLRAKFTKTIIVQGYGSTECAGVISLFRINDPEDIALLTNKPASCGRPVPGFSYKILDINTGAQLGFNQQGELYVKSPYLMSGYHNGNINNAFDGDGWLKTGDVVCIDKDFCFFVIDRLSEIINCNGWYVSPTTIEATLKTHPAVQEAVVIGAPQKEGGESPMAFVSVKRGYETITSSEIAAFVSERVDEKSKLTGGVRFVETFPLTPTRKISRRHLKNILIG